MVVLFPLIQRPLTPASFVRCSCTSHSFFFPLLADLPSRMYIRRRQSSGLFLMDSSVLFSFINDASLCSSVAAPPVKSIILFCIWEGRRWFLSQVRSFRSYGRGVALFWFFTSTFCFLHRQRILKFAGVFGLTIPRKFARRQFTERLLRLNEGTRRPSRDGVLRDFSSSPFTGGLRGRLLEQDLARSGEPGSSILFFRLPLRRPIRVSFLFGVFSLTPIRRFSGPV